MNDRWLARSGMVIALLVHSCAPAPQRVHLAAASPAASTPLPLAANSPRFDYRTTKLAEGVYAFVEPGPLGDLVSGNSLVVVGEDAVLVVDTGHFPSLARRMIGDIRKITDKPVRWVVTTHWHPDHLFGNAAYRDAFPGVTFLSHAETRRFAREKDPTYVTAQGNSAAILHRLEEALRTGKRSSGAAISSAEHLELEETIPALAQTLGDAQVELVVPTATFEGDEVSVFLGKREVRVMHLGRGNTAGDVVVYVPDAKVLAAGDMVVRPTPYAYASYLGEWSAGLRKLVGLGATMILPGHGPIETDTRYEQTLMALFDSVCVQAKAAVKDGLTLEQFRTRLDVSQLAEEVTGDDPSRRASFQSGFVQPGSERAYEEAKHPLASEE